MKIVVSESTFRAVLKVAFVNAVMGALVYLCVLLGLLYGGIASAQPYLYRADGVRGVQFFSDLSFLLGVEVKNEGSGVDRRSLVGEFSGNSRRAFLNDLSRAGRFAWAINKNKLTLSSRTSLLTRSYSFSSPQEYSSFRSLLRGAGIDAEPLIIMPLRRASSGEAEKYDDTNIIVYDIQAMKAFHESAETIYAGLSGEDQNRLISPSNSVIYPVAGEQFALMIFRLQYAWADDTRAGGAASGKLLPGVAGLMEKVVAARYGKSAPSRPPSGSQSGSVEELISGGVRKIKELGILPESVEEDSSSAGSSVGVANNLAPISTGASGLALSVGGKHSPLIFADPRQNAVIIYDDRDRYDYYRRLIGELDSRTRLVKIEAAIVDISKSEVSDLGIQWHGEYGGNEASFGSLAAGAASGALSFATGGFSLSNNAIVSNVNGLIARINLLESRGKGRVVSRPSILTLDNIEASLNSSEKFFVKIEAFQDSSLHPVEVDTTLKVTPHIIREGKNTRIKLLVVIEDGSISQSASTNVGGLPRITTNHLTTQAEILETQALVVGGHIRSEVSVRRRRVPLLGYIPIIGWPFKHNTKERQEFVRLYIIRPRLTLPADNMGGEASAVITDNELFAYPKLLSKEHEKTLKNERKREAKAKKAQEKSAKRQAKAAKRAAKKAAKATKNAAKEEDTDTDTDIGADVGTESAE